MTLEEKFLPYCDHEYGNRQDNAANCAEVADEYAISFAEFLEGRDLYLERKTIYEAICDFKKQNRL